MNDGREKHFARLRTHQRLSLHTPVIITSEKSSCLGQTENVSLGGALVSCANSFDPEVTNRLRFNLPTGYSITAMSKLVHRQPSSKLGLQFNDLDPHSRKELATFLNSLSDHTRRGARIPKRFSVAISKSKHADVEQLAETMVVSRSGGLLMCRGTLKPDDSFFIWWPQGKRGAEATVVWRRQGQNAGLAEVGFQFKESAATDAPQDNFWGMEFPRDMEE
ncbi:MAG TPA: PilZ domain-containing protein [Terriglobales bacterium]|nr:PilZ domain-containing protein [Terriglobales bacterium]